jgi:hypothetical protein
MEIRTEAGEIEAYVFERHIDVGGIAGIKEGLSAAPGVRFIGQFVGAFNLFARVVADDLGELQRRIAGEYFQAGVRSDWSVNLTGDRPAAPKRGSPEICALVRVKATTDPFGLLSILDEKFLTEESVANRAYGAAVVTASNFDLLVDLGADTVEEVLDLVLALRELPGIGRTSTALAALSDNEIRLPES